MSYTSSDYDGNPNIFPENNFTCSSAYPDGSVRNLGHSSDTSISTISLLESIFLRGDMSQYTTNVPNYAGNFSSFVITPPGEATFYGAPNYEGLSICLKPLSGYPMHWTWRLSDLGIEPGEIRSMKFGCDSE